MTLDTVTNRVNQVHYAASLGALTGAALGWCAPQWFGSIRQGAAMGALSLGTANCIGGVFKDVTAALEPEESTKKSIQTLQKIAVLVTWFTAAKGASYLGYTTTLKQAALCGAATFGAVLAETATIRREPIQMPQRIPPAMWALAGYAVGKLAPQWITPIDGAKLMGGLAMADIYWLHIWNRPSGSREDKPSIARDLIGSVLISTAILRLVPATKLVHMALASGLFYTQRHVRAKFGYA